MNFIKFYEKRGIYEHPKNKLGHNLCPLYAVGKMKEEEFGATCEFAIEYSGKSKIGNFL